MKGFFPDRKKDAEKNIENKQWCVREAKKIRKRIIALSKRKKDSMSLTQLCSKHNLPLAAVSKATNGRRVPRKSTLERIDAALKKEGA